MTNKEKRELKNGVISIFKRFNILDHAASIGGLRNDILRYINSLQEESVIVDVPPYDYVKGFSDGRLYEKRQKEEPIREDLEEEIKHFTMSEELYESNSVIKAVAQHFSNWQKEQDQETIELAEDHAMLAGMIKGKEEAIKKTIDFLNWIIGTGNSTIEEYKKYMNN